MNSSRLLYQAVELARAGKRDAARDIFLRVVEADPQNELAWMWLAGLVDAMNDKIIACENVLAINPSNEKARNYLESLKRRKPSHSPIQTVERNEAVKKANRP